MHLIERLHIQRYHIVSESFHQIEYRDISIYIYIYIYIAIDTLIDKYLDIMYNYYQDALLTPLIKNCDLKRSSKKTL